jgi:hypothetical protein
VYFSILQMYLVRHPVLKTKLILCLIYVNSQIQEDLSSNAAEAYPFYVARELSAGGYLDLKIVVNCSDLQ